MALDVNSTIGALLTSVDTTLDTSMGAGVSGGGSIAAGAYSQITDASLKQRLRDGFRLAFAALMSSFAEAWQNVSGFSNSWVASTPTPQYRREASDLVRMRGLITSGTSNTVAFTLPADYRPARTVTFVVPDGTANFATITIATNGQVTPQCPSGTRTVWLDNVAFALS